MEHTISQGRNRNKQISAYILCGRREISINCSLFPQFHGQQMMISYFLSPTRDRSIDRYFQPPPIKNKREGNFIGLATWEGLWICINTLQYPASTVKANPIGVIFSDCTQVSLRFFGRSLNLVSLAPVPLFHDSHSGANDWVRDRGRLLTFTAREKKDLFFSSLSLSLSPSLCPETKR